MKRIILLSALIQLLWQYANCQPHVFAKDFLLPNNNAKNKSLLKDDDTDFTFTQFNSKWNNESAIMLCQKTSLSFKKTNETCIDSSWFNNQSKEQKVVVEETTRRKILLKDKLALKQYAVLYFKLASAHDAFAARIIKKGGSVQSVDLADSEKVEDIRVVPAIFRSQADDKFPLFHRSSFYKLEVKNLEEGDIIEYEFVTLQPCSLIEDNKDFAVFYYPCEKDIPVQKQIIEIKTEDDKYSVTCKSLKGAPSFTQTARNGQKIYRWEDNDRDKIADTRYVNAIMETPLIKFRISCAKNKKEISISPDAGTGLHISMDKLAEKAQALWVLPKKQNTDIEAHVNHIYRSLKRKGVVNNTDEEYVRKAYYAIRSETVYTNWSDYTFAKVFAGIIEQKKLPYEVVVTTSNQQTNIEEISFSQELSWIIKFGRNYFSNPNEHGNPNELPPCFLGNMVIRFDGYDSKVLANIDSLPQGDETSNILLTQMNVRPDMSVKTNMYIDKIIEAKGCVKNNMINNVLACTPFIETDFKNYDGISMWDGLNNKERAKAITVFNQQKPIWKQEKAKMMSTFAETDYGFKVTRYNNFRLIQDGRSYKKTALKFGETFAMTGLITTEGEDVIIKLPALIGIQPEPEAAEHTRVLPIDMGYPCTRKWQIGFPVPDGYKAIDLNVLNEYIENELGSFESTARVNGDNTLMLEVIQTFKVKRTEATNWPQLQEILDASYKFSQLQITLKKK